MDCANLQGVPIDKVKDMPQDVRNRVGAALLRLTLQVRFPPAAYCSKLCVLLVGLHDLHFVSLEVPIQHLPLVKYVQVA